MTQTAIPACPSCKAQDWEFTPAGIHCMGCGHERENAKQAKKDMEGYMSLKDLQAAERRRAEAVTVDANELADWWKAQVAAVRLQIANLVAGMEANDIEAWEPSDARWGRYWMLDARLRYADKTLEVLLRRGHVLVCPNHGIKGVKAECDWEGLAFRGLLTGEGATDWLRYCAQCAKGGIETVAARLQRNHIQHENVPAGVI